VRPDAARYLPVSTSYLPGMPQPPYYRRWTVNLRGEQIGTVFAATEKAACLRAIHKFRISRKHQRELEVRRTPDAS
jgi:hypothetical protein